MVPPVFRGPTPGRILGLYALSVMERHGALYGYELAERVAERTSGAWRPGPGSVYPALGGLLKKGLVRAHRQGRRRTYQITPAGRQVLRRIRRGMSWRLRTGPDLGLLWAEVAGRDDPGEFMLERLDAQLSRLTEYLTARSSAGGSRDGLRRRAQDHLTAALGRLDSVRRSPAAKPVGEAA